MKKLALFTKDFGQSILEVVWEDLIPKKKDLIAYKNNGLRLLKRFLKSDQVYYGWKKDKKVFKFVLAPLTFALLVFAFVRPSLASLLGREERLAQYLVSNDAEIGVEADTDGYSQIYYVFEGEKKFVTTDSYPHGEPQTEGEYIAWMEQIDGYWQVFVYHITTDTTIQLTRSGSNANPKVSGNGNVVWEGWIESRDIAGNLFSEGWQLFLYDGRSIRQITQGDISINADIEGDYIVYARKNSGGLWRSEAYSIKDRKSVGIDIGNDTEYPRLENGDIYVGPPIESQKRYPLKVSDLFILGLDSLAEGDSEGQLGDIERILRELENVQFNGTESGSGESVQGVESVPEEFTVEAEPVQDIGIDPSAEPTTSSSTSGNLKPE